MSAVAPRGIVAPIYTVTRLGDSTAKDARTAHFESIETS